MRIHGWHIDGFGVHHDHHVTDLPKGLTVITGPNESGKTTLQHFVSGVLFGFPNKGHPDRHEPVNGGNFGGRLFITDQQGRAITIHRGAQKRSLRLVAANGDLPATELADLIGGASKELFGSVFAVHLEDLAKLRALTTDQVRERVFSAGIVGAGRTAEVALSELGSARDLLLRPSNRGAFLLKSLRDDLVSSRALLVDARIEAGRLPDLLEQIQLLDAEAEALRLRGRSLAERLQLLGAVQQLWPAWVAAEAARAELVALGPVPAWDRQAVAALREAVTLRAERAAALAIATQQLADAVSAADSVPTPGPAAAYSEVIDQAAIPASAGPRVTRRLTVIVAAVSFAAVLGLLAAGLPLPAIAAGAAGLALLAGGAFRRQRLRRGAAAVETAGTAQALADVNRLAQQLDLDPSADPLTNVELLTAIVQVALHQAQSAERAAGLVNQRRSHRDLAIAGLDAADAKLRALLGAAAVAVADAALADAALDQIERVEHARQFRSTIEDTENRLEAALASADHLLTSARALLTEPSADPANWATEAKELTQQETAAHHQRDAIVRQCSTVQGQVDGLYASAHIASLELQVSNLETQLINAVVDWASFHLAYQMVEGTLARYQRERQPEVVQRAGTLFQQITNRRYTRLEVRGNDVIAINRAAQEVPAASLSQGTTEQLYLCMRFALAESFSKTTSLPLLLDDITVNADTDRLPRLAQMIATFAQTQQVFVFSCQDRMVELLQQADPQARVITLPAKTSGNAHIGAAS